MPASNRACVRFEKVVREVARLAQIVAVLERDEQRVVRRRRLQRDRLLLELVVRLARPDVRDADPAVEPELVGEGDVEPDRDGPRARAAEANGRVS